LPLYSHEFQREVLYTLANNVVFATNYGCLLQDDSFDLAPMKTLFYLINQHMMQYETELERKDLLVLIEDYVSNRGWGSESLKVFKDEVRDIYLSKPKNEAFVADKVVQFVRKQALKRAIEDSITILEKSEEYEGVLKLIDKAISIGSGTQETKTIKDLINLPDVYRARYDPSKLIRTGFSRYDQALLGGLAQGELHIFIGPPGSGKSTFGCNIGAYNIALGKKVFHATMEIKDIDVLKHYALRLTAMTHTSFLTVDNEIWKKKMEKFRKFENNLFVAYWPEKTINALTIRAWIAQHRSTLGIQPDLILIDYDDLLVPVGGSTNDMYEDAGSIYGELIQLADYFKCFTGDTKISLVNGEEKRMDELLSGEELCVYSYDKDVIIEKAIALGVIDYTNIFYGIELNNGEIVKCTPDHKFMMKDGTYKEAQYLNTEDNLMSLDNKIKIENIIKIELAEKEAVYCINVPRTGNFALSSGIIVGNCPIITFAQTRRDAWDLADGEVIVSHHLAHSAKKAHKAYSVTSLNFKKGAQKGKLYIDKCRRGEDGVFIDMERDLSRSYFGEKSKNTHYDDEPRSNQVEEKDKKND